MWEFSYTSVRRYDVAFGKRVCPGNSRRIYLAFTVVGGLAAVGFALFANGFWTALVFRALAGLGLAGTFIPGLKALVDRLDGTAQARAISFYTATFGLGTSLSYFATGQLDALLGWRWAFAFGAAGSALALLLVATVLRPQTPQTVTIPPARLLDFRRVLRNSRAIAYILAYAAHTWELFTVRSWIVAFLAFSLRFQADPGKYISPSSVAVVLLSKLRTYFDALSHHPVFWSARICSTMARSPARVVTSLSRQASRKVSRMTR